jgi:hypothetical protein
MKGGLIAWIVILASVIEAIKITPFTSLDVYEALKSTPAFL